jgi:hypothetical protein
MFQGMDAPWMLGSNGLGQHALAPIDTRTWLDPALTGQTAPRGHALTSADTLTRRLLISGFAAGIQRTLRRWGPEMPRRQHPPCCHAAAGGGRRRSEPDGSPGRLAAGLSIRRRTWRTSGIGTEPGSMNRSMIFAVLGRCEQGATISAARRGEPAGSPCDWSTGVCHRHGRHERGRSLCGAERGHR